MTRTAYAENPPRAECELTALGRSPLGPMDTACDWGRRRLREPLGAREASEALDAYAARDA